MSEEEQVPEEEPAKKKKGKLPIILALVIVLAGGGFFMMKGKGGSHEPPPVKLGIVEPLAEFLVNLREPNSYLRAEVSLHLKDGYTKEEFDKCLPSVRDAIILTLGSRSIQQVRTLDGKLKLKKDLVASINKVLEAAEAELHEDAPKDEEKAGNAGTKKDPLSKGAGSSDQIKDPKPKAPEHPDWDSQTGPVLKLYFTSFTTQ